MQIGWNTNTIVSILGSAVSVIGCFFIIRINWKQYGSLFVLSGIIGMILCYIFLAFGFYEFPFRLFPTISKIPFTLILTMFPLYVLAGVRYSPKQWSWKIPFYWVIVHIGVFSEMIMEKRTDIIRYSPDWGLWDSYVWWWLFLLIFEFVGGLLVKPEFRKPQDVAQLRFGTIGWFIHHFILILTFFLAGVYAGRTIFR